MLSKTDRLTRSDEELAERVAQGDEGAFTELYKRHLSGIHDHAARTMGDRDSAADVAQATFVKALELLRQGRAVQHVKAWLYAIARNKSIDELRYRKRLKPAGEIDERNDPVFWGTTISLETSDPQTVVIEKEAARLVWTSAAALSPKDYSLLDLHVRRGLTSDELAESLGLRRGAVYTRLSRLKDALERSVTSEVMLRQGRRDCPELDALLGGMNATKLTREISKAIQEHVRDCDNCQESKKRYVTAVEILAGLAPLPATPKIEGLWDDHGKRNGHRPTEARRLKLLPRESFSTAFRTHRLLAAGTVATVATSLVVVTVLIASSSTSPVIEDPVDVHSVSHDVGRPSEDNIVEMAWTSNPDADAYSVEWSNGEEQLPDTTADLGGDADGATSPPLAAGSWYFNMRTGADEEWTHTVHVGPFIIEEASDEIFSSEPNESQQPPSPPDKDRHKKDADDDTSPTLALGPPSPPAPPQDEPPPDDGSPPNDDPPREDPPPPPPPDDDPPPPEETALAPPTITSAPAELSNDVRPQWSFAGARGSRFECSLRGGPFEPCTSPASYEVSDLGDGPYLFQVLQEDPSGNRSDPAADVFTLDTLAPPAPKITGRPAQFTSDPNIGFLFEGEPDGVFECALTNGTTKPPLTACSSPRIYNLTFEPDGVYTFAVQQTDPAGNVSLPSTYSFELIRRQSE